MEIAARDGHSVVLGAGELFISLASAITDPFNLTATEEAALTNVGFIESDATITTKREVVPTYGGSNRAKYYDFTQVGDVTFSTGVIDWNLESVASFLTGSTYTENAGTNTFDVAAGDHSPVVFLRFIGKDEGRNKQIVVDFFNCQFTGELEMVFGHEDPVTFDYTFDVLATRNAAGKQQYYKIVEKPITVPEPEPTPADGE